MDLFEEGIDVRDEVFREGGSPQTEKTNDTPDKVYLLLYLNKYKINIYKKTPVKTEV